MSRGTFQTDQGARDTILKAKQHKTTETMETNFHITTTDGFQGGKITSYLGMVCANVVVGTNVFSDFAASVSDFFGGKSGTYRGKLEYIYREALDDLKQKALKLGANAVVGARADFDEISGKGKSMLMVSVSGTACLAEMPEGDRREEAGQAEASAVGQDELDREITRMEIIDYVKEYKRIPDKWIDFMRENPIEEILDIVIYVFSTNRTYVDQRDQRENTLSLLAAYGRDLLIPEVYGLAAKEGELDCASDLIHSLHLFDAARVLELCREDHKKGATLLGAKSDTYDERDLAAMEEICGLYDSLPDTGTIEKVTKSGMFSKKEEEKFICERGHENETYNEFCYQCGVNIKGLNRTEATAVEKFKRRTEALKAIFRGNAKPK